MGRLFSIEMKKLWKSTAMRVMIFVSLGLCLLNVIIYALMKGLMENLNEIGLGINGYRAFASLATDNSDSMLFTVLLIAILIGGDFAARTLQTQLSAGYSRFQVIISRYLSTLVAFMIFFTIYTVAYAGGVTLVLGFGKPVTSDVIGELIINNFMGLFMSASILSIYLFICFLVKSTGASIGICLPFMLIGVTILQTLTYAFETAEKIVSFTPFGQLMVIGNELEALDYVKFYSVAIVWLVGIISLIFVTFRKAELK